MILRRVLQHVREQNWFAVALDFLIVVVGVFLGFQVTAWTNGQADRDALRHALLRFDAEVTANQDSIAQTRAELEAAIPEVSHAIDALRRCDTSPQAEAVITAGINQSAMTRGIRFRIGALRELTGMPRLLSQQSDEQRRILQGLQYDLEIMEAEAATLEHMPFENPVWQLDAVAFAAAQDVSFQYRGYDFNLPIRSIELAVPVGEACQDSELMSNLYEWERLQLAVQTILDIAAGRLDETRAALTESGGDAP